MSRTCSRGHVLYGDNLITKALASGLLECKICTMASALQKERRRNGLYISLPEAFQIVYRSPQHQRAVMDASHVMGGL